MRFLPVILSLIGLLRIDGAEIPSTQPGYLVRVWQSQDGLPGNVVRSLVQASDGYLWVATAEGVARFDGFEFEVIEPEGDVRRNRLAFSRLFTTSGGHVWAATHQGGLLRSNLGTFTQVVDDVRTAAPAVVTQLIDDANGIIYFKSGSVIRRIDANDEITQITPSPELLQKFDEDLKMQTAGGRFLDDAGRLALHDRRGRTWSVGTAGGLTVAKPGEPGVAIQLPENGQGFAINELLEDVEGNIWVASPIAGLVRIRQARVEVPDANQGQTERAVYALREDRAGTWWIANRRGGLNRWTADGFQHFDLTRSGNPRPAAALFEDRDSRLWVATRDGSVFKFEEGTFSQQFAKTQIPSKVRSITQDSKGVLWFGGSQGLASNAGETVRQYGRESGVGDLDITVLRPFSEGRIIAGSSTGTVLLGDEKGFQTIGKPETLMYQWVSGILPLTAKENWFSTLGGGLFLWNGETWSCFDANDGIPDSRLTSIVDDEMGHLWMGSLSGIIRADRKELLNHLRNPSLPVRWLVLDHTDGLPSRECVGGYQPAGWRAHDGVLWFPTGGGIVRVHPDLVIANTIAPPVYLQKVRANGVVQPTGSGTVTTAPGRARLEFHFVGISLGAPEKVTYRARLAGLDDAWRELGSQRVAAFEAVPPGKYTFEVVAVNGDGLPSASPARIPVVIEPHFWETGWFFLSVGALILSIAIGIGWLAARLRMKRRIELLKIRNARESERTRIARDLHDDLGASLTEISILAALAAEDAEKTPFQQPLEQLSVKTKHAVGSLDEIVWAVNPREDTLRSLVDYLAAFAHEFLDIARIPLRLDTAREIPDLPVPTSQRHAVFLATREALNNVVKHSQATMVMLRFTLADGALEICIEDNGRGFDLEYAQGGNGIGNLSQRMQEVGGSCRISTARTKGTTVFLTLPLSAAGKAL